MKKLVFLFVLGTVFNSMALSGLTYKYIWKAGDTVTFTKLKTNDDSTRIWTNRAGDTSKTKMNYNQVFHNHDSTFTYTNIDTIAGKVRMDTVVDLDSIYSDVGKFKGARIDTLKKAIIIKDSLIFDSGKDSINAIILKNASYPTHFGTSFFPYYSGSQNFGLSIRCAYAPLPYRFTFNLYNGYLGINDDNPFWSLSVNGLGHFNGLYNYGNFYDTGMVACSNVLTNYIQFGTGANSKCSTYIDTTFPDSMWCDGIFVVAGTGRIIQIGNHITFSTSVLNGTISGGDLVQITGIPSKFRPNVETSFNVIVVDNTVLKPGLINITTSGACSLFCFNGTGYGNFLSGPGGISTSVIPLK
jgi:hypothetical protein